MIGRKTRIIAVGADDLGGPLEGFPQFWRVAQGGDPYEKAEHPV